MKAGTMKPNFKKYGKAAPVQLYIDELIDQAKQYVKQNNLPKSKLSLKNNYRPSGGNYSRSQ